MNKVGSLSWLTRLDICSPCPLVTVGAITALHESPRSLSIYGRSEVNSKLSCIEICHNSRIKIGIFSMEKISDGVILN